MARGKGKERNLKTIEYNETASDKRKKPLSRNAQILGQAELAVVHSNPQEQTTRGISTLRGKGVEKGQLIQVD